METKTERDLKNLIDQGLSKILKSSPAESKNPFESFLKDERRMATRLLKIIQGNIDDVRLEGTKVPEGWISEWSSGPAEIVPFVNGLLSRHQALNLLGSDLPARVNFFWFARPRAFLAALKQYTARESGHPLENLRLRANWSEGSEIEDWKTSIVIDGLLLTGIDPFINIIFVFFILFNNIISTGAAIKEGILKELAIDDAPVVAVPDCQIAYLPSKNLENLTEENWKMDTDFESENNNWLEVPVYTDSQRNLLICSLPVGCPEDERDIWLRRGIAFHLRSS